MGINLCNAINEGVELILAEVAALSYVASFVEASCSASPSTDVAHRAALAFVYVIDAESCASCQCFARAIDVDNILLMHIAGEKLVEVQELAGINVASG